MQPGAGPVGGLAWRARFARAAFARFVILTRAVFGDVRALGRHTWASTRCSLKVNRPDRARRGGVWREAVAVDSYCWLHRGAYSCSAELVEGVPTDKFIASFVKRAALLRRCGVEAVYVFGGGRMPGSRQGLTDSARARQRATAPGRTSARETQMLRTRRISAQWMSPRDGKAVIDRLRAEGHACVVAPYEADARWAPRRHGFVDGVITEDSDMIRTIARVSSSNGRRRRRPNQIQ